MTQEELRTLKITLAYDGTAYVGWQRQANGTSIQGLVEQALSRIEGAPVAVVGAGRTDAGVHALGQVASVRLASPLGVETLGHALNAMLPPDVRILAVEAAPAGFHARYSARSKTYRYCIVSGEISSPFTYRYQWHLNQPLDIDAMAEAARLIEGRHDFAAFQATGSATKTTVRTVFTSRITMSEPGEWRVSFCGGLFGLPASTGLRAIVYEATGDGFLRYMVRAIVGTLTEIGAGRRAPQTLADAIRYGDRSQVGPTAPAHGLWLMAVGYEDPPRP